MWMYVCVCVSDILCVYVCMSSMFENLYMSYYEKHDMVYFLPGSIIKLPENTNNKTENSGALLSYPMSDLFLFFVPNYSIPP